VFVFADQSNHDKAEEEGGECSADANGDLLVVDQGGFLLAGHRTDHKVSVSSRMAVW